MKRLKFNKASCIGCQLCAQVCSAFKEGEYIPSKARIAIETTYDNGNLVYHDHYCILCGICAKACPCDAITVGEHIEVDMEKCSVIINKYMKSSLTPAKIMDALAFYNNPNPDMLVYDELLSKKTKRFIIPFDEQNYLRYIENLYTSKMNFSGFSDEFKQAISIIIQEIFPLGGRPLPRNNQGDTSGFMGIFRKK